jgi:fluoroacetyl-CoA thioesterase
MLESLVPGLENTKTYAITEDMCTGHTGTPVLSTPSMIGLMEGTCLESAQEHLGETEVTVGIHVCVSHVAGSQLGEEVTVRSKLAEIERGRFLTYEVSAAVGDRVLGEGTHKRAVLDTARMKK